MTEFLLSVGVTVGFPVVMFLGVLVGVVASVYLMREDLRTAQRGVDEARSLLVEAGLGHLVPGGAQTVPATPTTDRGEVKR